MARATMEGGIKIENRVRLHPRRLTRDAASHRRRKGAMIRKSWRIGARELIER